MQLNITHTTKYNFGKPISYGLQRLLMHPANLPGQELLSWTVTVDDGVEEVRYIDHHQNTAVLYSFDTGTEEITIKIDGVVKTTDVAGVVGRQRSFTPLWYYKKQTPLTKLGTQTRKLLRKLGDKADRVDITYLHDLSAIIAGQVEYKVGVTDSGTTAEDALLQRAGVCQDHAHIFITVARAMDYPARYVSGYLFMDGQVEQTATHAWAEAFVPDLGWVGFDVSNRISPDERYVRVACGLDYKDAAPTTGLTYGAGDETIDITLRVEQ